MAGITRENPLSIMITPNNWFNLGWLEAVLGRPSQSGREWDDRDKPINDVDIDMYQDGYDMGLGMDFDLTQVFKRMLDLKILMINTEG